MITECKYCSTRFSTSNHRKVFCSDRCKVRYNRENSLTCFYCGDLPGSKDHVTPHSTTGLKNRVWSGVDYVMCCKECNMLMGDNHPNVLSHRINFLIGKFTKKHKLNRPRIQWDEDEISELGRSLADYVRNGIKEWNRNNQRLDHMRLRYIQIASDELEAVNNDKEKPATVDAL